MKKRRRSQAFNTDRTRATRFIACWMLALGVTTSCGLRQSADLVESRQGAKNQVTPKPSPTPIEATSAGAGDVHAGSTSGTSSRNSVLEYDLDHPVWTMPLPNELREISDITLLTENEIACVQDEQGIVFVYNLQEKRITDHVRFAPHGDYEGLAAVDSQIFVLRSDGVLYQLASLRRRPSVQKIDLHLPFSESEGLCLDSRRHRLLIAPKSRKPSGNGKDTRPIYAFDLNQQALLPTPVFDISLRDIRRFAKQNDLPIPRRPKKNGESMHNALHFLPSAVAVHPSSGEVYVVSAVDHVLVSCDGSGTVTGYGILDASIFRQPEGIAFMPNGDMLISNEAAGKVATLVLLKRQRRDGLAGSN